MQDSERAQEAKCGLCGEPMPEGEEMFKFHGYSGGCPKPPLAEVAKYLGSMLAVDTPPSGASPQAETLHADIRAKHAEDMRSTSGKFQDAKRQHATSSLTVAQVERLLSPASVSPVEPEPPTVECCACGHLNTPQQATRLEGEWRSSGEYVCLDSDACSRRIAKCSEPTVEPEPPTNPPCARCGHALSAHRPEFGACDGRDRPCACPEYQVPTAVEAERAKACHLCGAPMKVEREP